MSLNASRSGESLSTEAEEARDGHRSGLMVQESDEEFSTLSYSRRRHYKIEFAYQVFSQSYQQNARCNPQLWNMSKPSTNLKISALSCNSSTYQFPPTLRRYRAHE